MSRPCKYGGDLDNCPFGFPGCVCADEMMAEEEGRTFPTPQHTEPKSTKREGRRER